MAPAWCVRCDSWEGSQHTYGEKTLWTGQFVTSARFLRGPGNPRKFCSFQKQAAASSAWSARCIARSRSSDASNEGDKLESQQLTWKTIFLDHTQWWDCRHQKKNSRLLGFRYKESGEPLWLKNCYQPSWMDAQLAILDARTDHIALAASLCAGHGAQLLGSEFDYCLTPKLVKKLCKQGRVEGAVKVMEVLVGTSSGVDKNLLYCVLKECVAKKDLMLGGQVHALAVKMGFGSDTFLCTHLIRMYAAHRKLREAMDVFRGVALPNAFMWSSIISAYAKQGQAQRAIELYQHMRATVTKPDKHVFVAALHACAVAGDLQFGKQLHSQTKESGLESDLVVGGCLVNMYAKCGRLVDARAVFDGLREKDVVTWTAMIAGYAQQEGMGQDALSLYSAMQHERMAIPNAVTFVCLLKACANVGVSAIGRGKQLHLQVKERGLGSDSVVGGCLVNMYAKCGSVLDARIVFDSLRDKSVVTWNAMIAGYAQEKGMGQDALSLYGAMQNEGLAVPNAVTFVCLLQACANAGVPALGKGKQLHSQIRESGLESDMIVGGSLVNMYTKCGSLTDARVVFDGLHEKNVVTWTAMIAGYAQQEGMGQDALSLYGAMHNEGMAVPNAVTFVCLLHACANAGVSAFERGKQLHSQIKERELESDVVVGGCLVNMYAKCGSLMDARIVFDGLREKDVVTWNSMIAGYAKVDGMGQDALSMYSAMQNEGMAVPNAVTFVCLLQACVNAGVSAFEKGKQLHSQIKERGLESDTVLGGCLVNMYAKCGSLTDARIVFDGLREKNVVTWNAMLSGYAQQEGMGQDALRLYSAMHSEGMAVPNAVTFVCLLQACANVGVAALEKGKQLHSQVRQHGLECDIVVGGCLVNMYVKCGSLTDARIVFDGLREKNVVTWNAMISGYAQQESMGQYALHLYSVMQNEGMAVPDAVTFVCLLQACANFGVSALEKGKQLHSQTRERGLDSDVVVGGSLVNMYAKCGSLTDARLVFDGLCERNVATWNAMISGYAQQKGMSEDAFSLYGDMHSEGMAVPNAVTFVCLLQACTNAGVSAREKGMHLHSQIRERGLDSDVVVGNCLANMYAKCGSLTDARAVFDALREKDVVTWNAMISGYARQEGMGQEALNIYSAMRNEGVVTPNAVTFVCLLQACANVGASALGWGKQLHSQIEERGFDSDAVLSGCLVNMYAKCGSLVGARSVFDGLREKNVATWTAMITGYAQQESMGQEALNIYSAMLHEGMATPDSVTFASLLQACANVGVTALEKGKQLHSQIKERGLECDMVVGGCLVNMYARCGSVVEARRVFDGLSGRSVVTWTAMIAGYAQQEGMGQEALNIYNAMRKEGMAVPNAVTFVCLLQACASVGALQQGKELHSEIREAGLETDAVIATCLVKMYAQCGRLEVSREVFDRLPRKSVETWTALIDGYAEHGDGRMAIQFFEESLEQGVEPNGVTYICLLTACSRSGLVVEGHRYFESMEERHGVKPDERHYNCMVDLLGRSGHVDRAEKMLRASCLASSVVSWTALLSACKSYGDADVGRRCFDRLVSLEPADASAYVLLGGMYANAGRWDEVERIESLRKAAGARKKAAKACIEVNKEVHEFTVGEERSDVAASLRSMNTRVKEGGHAPQTQLVLRANVSEQEMEDALCGHAEKLALAYGLLNTSAGSTLVVTKNLRMCGDCHSSTKVMSQVEKREIVVRDGNRVHRFRNGACSCQEDNRSRLTRTL